MLAVQNPAALFEKVVMNMKIRDYTGIRMSAVHPSLLHYISIY
jgi:hypothetical protein